MYGPPKQQIVTKKKSLQPYTGISSRKGYCRGSHSSSCHIYLGLAVLQPKKEAISHTSHGSTHAQISHPFSSVLKPCSQNIIHITSGHAALLTHRATGGGRLQGGNSHWAWWTSHTSFPAQVTFCNVMIMLICVTKFLGSTTIIFTCRSSHCYICNIVIKFY